MSPCRPPLEGRCSAGAFAGFAAAFALASLSLLFFFRREVFSGFTQVTGGGEDLRILVAMLEHWYRVVTGGEAVRDPLFFFPTKGVLGFTDAYVVHALFYVVFRALGADIFQAFQFTIMALKLVGGMSMYLLLRHGLRLRLAAALFGCVVFLLWNAALLTVGHGQFFAIGLLPAILYCLLLAWETRRLAPVFGFGVLYCLLLLSSYNLGWYFALSAAVAVPLIALVAGLRQGWGMVFAELGRDWRFFGALLVIPAICLVPFLAIYLPAAQQTGPSDFAQAVLPSMPAAYDIVNLGRDNLLWGRILTAVFRHGFERPMQWELTKGAGPLAFLCVAGVALWWTGGLKRADRKSVIGWLVAATILVMWAISFKAGAHYLPWRVVYQYFPGGRAIRAIGRMYLFLAVYFIPVMAIAVDRCLAGRRGKTLGGALIAVLLLEQLNLATVTFDHKVELAWLQRVPPPPAACGVFFVSGRSPRPWVAADDPIMIASLLNEIYPPQVDAMLIAELTGVPTINGYSSVFPPGFSHWNSSRPEYRQQVADWFTAHPVDRQICDLDLTQAVWRLTQADAAGGTSVGATP